MSTRKLCTLFALTILTCWLAVPSFADSQARIVRLSQVDGDVQIDRNTGHGLRKGLSQFAHHSRHESADRFGRQSRD